MVGNAHPTAYGRIQQLSTKKSPEAGDRPQGDCFVSGESRKTPLRPFLLANHQGDLATNDFSGFTNEA